MTLSVLQTKKAFAIEIALILIFATVVRFWRLSVPSTYYFDEVYHAVTSKLVARNDPRAFEWWNEPPEKDTAVDWLHPPLAKYTQGLSMKILGENSFGWRFSSAVFGVLTIGATALLAHIAFQRRFITVTATLFASLDGLLLTQSRIAMNDIHVTFTILLAAIAYLRYRQKLHAKILTMKQEVRHLIVIGLLSGIAMGTKWSGLFILGPIGLFEGLYLLSRHFKNKRQMIQAYGLRLITLLVLPFCIYVLSYGQMFLQGKTLVCTGTEVLQGSCYCSQESSPWVNILSAISPGNRPFFESLEGRGGCKRLISHFSELQDQIWWYQTNLKATHPYQSRPWQWALDLRPVWTSVTYGIDGEKVANIYTAGNPVLFWGGLVAAVCLGTLVLRNLVKKRKIQNFELAFVVALYAVVWMPWTLSPRIMFFYHYTPAVPLLAILLAYGIEYLPLPTRQRRMIAGVCIGIVILAFVFLFPIFTGYPMNQSYFDLVFRFFPSWK